MFKKIKNSITKWWLRVFRFYDFNSMALGYIICQVKWVTLILLAYYLK